MVDPIDVPDNLAKTQLPDKLKKVARSSPERERDGFSKALQEELEEELKKKRRKPGDTVQIEHNNDEMKQDQDNDKQHEPSEDRREDVENTAATGESASPEEPESAEESSRHVDLKA